MPQQQSFVPSQSAATLTAKAARVRVRMLVCMMARRERQRESVCVSCEGYSECDKEIDGRKRVRKTEVSVDCEAERW